MDFNNGKTQLFDGLCFSLSLMNESLSTKKDITQFIKINGGQIVIGLPKETTHLVTGVQEIIDNSFKVKTAQKNGIFVVIPSFVLDSVRYCRREPEWNHMIINGKSALEIGRSEEDCVLNGLSKGIQNVISVMKDVQVVEHSFETALSNISGLCTNILFQWTEISEIQKLSFSQLVSRTHSTLARSPTKSMKIIFSWNISAKNKQEKQNLPFTRVNQSKLRTFLPEKSTSKSLTIKKTTSSILNSIPREKYESSFSARITEKKRLQEAKELRMKEEKQRKDEERTKRENEKKIREEEKQKKVLEMKEKQEKIRRKMEEDRNKSLKELEERFLNRYENFFEIQQQNSQQNEKEVVEISEEQRLTEEKEKKKKLDKEVKKAKKS